ncbi:hypothetical protein OE88DRAFT_1646169 [Heliocybe sulcata]|uniref:Uncharacterized protein n=1 Tax=Heliocybe sulcata TaxID=5364 RepID=A0A5C3N139_9AGAM|nr:hypothetical protein OE88DRAFT_1646169 [Heliocybe sulcata]
MPATTDRVLTLRGEGGEYLCFSCWLGLSSATIAFGKGRAESKECPNEEAAPTLVCGESTTRKSPPTSKSDQPKHSQNGKKTDPVNLKVTSSSALAVTQSPRTLGRIEKFPVVDRSILDKLDRLQSTKELDFIECLLYGGPDYSSQRTWPPLVTHIPEARKPDLARRADMDFCGFSPCRLLLPARIAEQESKARQHLLQLLQLSRALNRTLVLPNVGKSRLGACMKFEFGAYYDLASFQLALESVESPDGRRPGTLTMDSFKAWLSARRHSVTSQVVFIDTNAKSGLAGSKTLQHDEQLEVRLHDDDTVVYKRAPCFKTKYKRLFASSPFFPLSVHLSNNRSAASSRVVDMLSDDDLRWAAFKPKAQDVAIFEPDVLAVDWDLRHPLFLEDLTLLDAPKLEYAIHLKRSANMLSSSLRPYLAIHWRLESVPLKSLRECAYSLVDRLVDILSSSNSGNFSGAQGIRTVWIATDYPYPVTPSSSLDGSGKRSGTFKTISPEHVEAIGVFNEAFRAGGRLQAFRLTDLNGRLNVLEEDFEAKGGDSEDARIFEDEGATGILDKLVATNADLFVSGAEGCSRTSSFTRQIVEARKAGIENGEQSLRNIVEFFGR